MDPVCVLCGDVLSAGIQSCVKEKGLKSLTECSKQRRDGLHNVFESTKSLTVHLACRNQYTRPNSIEKTKRNTEDISSDTGSLDLPSLRSTVPTFNFKMDCLFCGRDASLRKETKKCVKYRRSVHEVTTLPFKQTVLDAAESRHDEWGRIVALRIADVVDLVAAEAKYHKDCYTNFQRGRSLQSTEDSKVGRPEDSQKREVFEHVCTYLETSEECQFSVAQIEEYMEAVCQKLQCEPYTRLHLKQKLIAHYGNQILMTELPGQNAVFNFKETAHNLLYETWYKDRKEMADEERLRIVKKAAEIIRQDIRSTAYDTEVYPLVDATSLSSDIVPDTLKCLVETLVTSKSEHSSKVQRKQAALCQAIVSGCRPKSFLSPVLLGVGVYVHRTTGSRHLLELLSNLGFSVSYNEVQRYENCVIAQKTSEETQDLKDKFTQFSFDNADFNIRTLTGHNTFHSMGGIMCSTPGSDAAAKPVPRLMHVTAAEITRGQGSINISWYKKPREAGLKRLIVERLAATDIETQRIVDRSRALDTLWLSASWSGVEKPPSWNGFMKSAMSGMVTCERSQVEVLPFVNLSPSDPSTIYTSLKFASKQCDMQGQKHCIVTFDQPLFMKAAEIIAACKPESLCNVIVRLGGFHTAMAYMGALGYVMSGSGIEELWETVYAKASVVHMLSGHAYSRALRAYLLTHLALSTILLETCEVSEDDTATKCALKELFFSFLENENTTPEDVFLSSAVTRITSSLHDKIEEMSKLSRTAALWLQFYREIDLLRLFIRAERTGNWSLHLHCVREMLPVFHGAGRYNYAKAAHLYVQLMENLEQEMDPMELAKFTTEGYFTIRRNSEFWSGVWSDQVIEQDLMRPLKSQSGLTHGRGITESTLAHYIHAFPGCLRVCKAMEEFCNVTARTAEQHVDLRDSRRLMDERDAKTLKTWLETYSPFEASETLHSLSTGVVADQRINCDEFRSIGAKGIESIVGKTFHDATISRKSKVMPLSLMNGKVTVRDEIFPVSSTQLFLRMVCVMKTDSDKGEYFRYELSPTPPALFDGPWFRKTDKSSFASIFTHCAASEIQSEEVQFVVDGGYLLRAVVWPRPAKYGEICQLYIKYVQKHYPSAVVVFDGYDEQQLSTKGDEQRRRSSKRPCPEICFNEATTASHSQTDFMSNGKNKASLLRMITPKLQAVGVMVRQATADADTLIVETALELESSGKEVCVIGTDTDLLVMLIARARGTGNITMLHPSTSKATGKLYNIGSIQNEIGDMKNAVLFCHAMTGCDTTSAIYGKGKRKGFEVARKNVLLHRQVEKFSAVDVSRNTVCEIGEAFIKCLYPGGDLFDSVDELRLHLYKRAIAHQPVTASFDLATLPPTRAAANQHSLRAYVQVQEWLGRHLPPTNWGWRQTGHVLTPIYSTLPPAPESLLKLISCECKGDCAGGRCTCRQTGQVCGDMCAYCKGTNCTNAPEAELDPDDDL